MEHHNHSNQPPFNLHSSTCPRLLDNLSLIDAEWEPLPLTESTASMPGRPSLSAMTALFQPPSSRNNSNGWSNTSRQSRKSSISNGSGAISQAGVHRHRARRPSTILADLGRGLLGQRTSDYGAEESVREAHKHNAWLRKIQKPFRKEQTLAQDGSDKILRDDSFYSPTSTSASASLSQMQYAHGGAAARAAAAAYNGSNLHLSKESSRFKELGNDSESGIGIDLNEKSVDEQARSSMKDPAAALPEEIFVLTLSFLDAKSLDACLQVNRRWHQTAEGSLIWRNLFARDFGLIAPSQALRSHSGGLGYGKDTKDYPDQHWEHMYKARSNIQSNWRNGKATAIYLEGHTDTVYCVQYDENKAITGSRDRTLRIWDLKTWKCIKVIGTPKPSNYMHPTAPIPPILRGVTPVMSYTRYARESQLKPHQHPDELTHSGSILCLQFDKDILVTGSSDTTVIVWDIKQDYKPVMRLRRHTAGVLDVCFDDKYIISCSKDTTLCIWSRETGELIRKLAGHKGPVNAVQLRSNLLVSASGDGAAKLWDLRTGLCIKEYSSRDRGLACVEFSPDCSTIYAGGNDQSIYQFDAETREVVHEFKGHGALVRSLHLDHINNRIVSGSYDHSIQVYDTNIGHRVAEFAGWTTSWMLSAKSDYRYIFATSQDRRIVVMDFGYNVPRANLLRAEE